MPEKRPALGRGLSALIPDAPVAPPPPPPAPPVVREATTTPLELDLDLLSPNPFQPRVHFDDAKLDELTRSIRSNGLIQPITVRPAGKAAAAGAKYEIVAGERRWRAAQRAGLLRVPVIVKDVPDEKLLELALIENIQREDLNAIDEALAYRRLMDEFHLTQDDIAVAVGKDRSSVANYLRLLKLPIDIQNEVASGNLSMGHARALLAIDQEEVLRRAARSVLAARLSVRETEALVREAMKPPAPKDPEEAPRTDANTRAAEEQLRLALGTRVRIMRKGGGGRVEIDFVSEDELNRIYEYILDRR